MDLFLPMSFWTVAALAITGIIRLVRPRLPHTLFDRTHRAIGWLALASLGPALIGAVIHLVKFPDDAPTLVVVFPMLWFVVLGGASGLAVTEWCGVSPASAEGEGVWGYVVGGLTLAFVVIAARSFRGVQPGQRRIPESAQLVGVAVLLNSIVGLLLMTPMLLDD